MAFDSIINNPTSESELLNQIVTEIQLRYLAYKNLCFFMKLGQVTEKSSQIIWIKTFVDVYELSDFYYNTKFERACILVKFHEGRYELLCQGYHLSDGFEIWPDIKPEGRPFEITWNRETDPMVSRELLQRAFGEITDKLAFTKQKKSI